MAGLGKFLIWLGVILILAGTVITFAGRIPWIGRLPGDICIKRENFTFYFPLTTSILLSVILSLILLLMGHRR